MNWNKRNEMVNPACTKSDVQERFNKFLVVRKQTKMACFCWRDENSQFVNKSTNGCLHFKHPFASTLQWNIQLIRFLKNISQEHKASNEQIISKTVAFSFFQFCRKSFTSFLRIKTFFSALKMLRRPTVKDAIKTACLSNKQTNRE